MDRRPAAELGCAAAANGSTTWTSSGPTRTTRSPSSSGTSTASAVMSASRRTTTVRRPEKYATPGRDFGTSCERCHGPGSAHVQAYTPRGAAPPAGEAFIVRPTRLDPKTSSMICAQCHSLRNAVDPGFKAGKDYYDYFMPRLEYDPRPGLDSPYWPDGRPRRFSNDAIGLWQSECFLRGRATCTSCHQDPHEPDVDRNPQLAARNNALCTGCHQEIGARLSAHTRHRRRQRRQLVRRVPHAQDGDQHQGDDARSHDRACRRRRTPWRLASLTPAPNATRTGRRRGR